jgi:hypothetical protein
VIEDFGPRAGGSAGALGHGMSMIISYDHKHINVVPGRSEG